jgi:hypothetical protein
MLAKTWGRPDDRAEGARTNISKSGTVQALIQRTWTEAVESDPPEGGPPEVRALHTP